MPAPSLEEQICEIQDALMERCEALGAIVAQTVWREVAFYAESGHINRAQFTANCVENFRFMTQGLDAPAAFDTSVAARGGTEGALAGTPLAALMETFRIGARLAWEEIINLAAARPHIGKEALIRATARIWLAQDVFTNAMASAYREDMNRNILAHAAERAALVEALIEGTVVEQASLWEIATMLRIPTRGPYVIVAAECASVGRAALPGIEAKLSNIGIISAWRLLPDVELGLVHVGGDADFDTLRQTLSRAAATRTGISTRFHDLGRTPEAVTYARMALTAERADGSLVGVFEADPLAIAAVSAPRVMKQICVTVLAGFADLDSQDREMLFTTFRTWIAAGGAISTAAERLYCHPNTVRHRLRRIEELTGKLIGRPRDLAELCLAFEIDYRLS